MSSAATRLDRHVAARDLDELPHEWDTRYELIGGVLHMSRRPSHDHQQILARLVIRVGAAVLERGGDVVQEAGVVWDPDGDDNVAPDLAILLRAPSLPRGEKLSICPDIVVEVLSPGEDNRARDLFIKRELYFRRGAHEYWIVDPAHRRILRLTRGPTEWLEQPLGPDEVLNTPLIAGWSGLLVADVFPPG